MPRRHSPVVPTCASRVRQPTRSDRRPSAVKPSRAIRPTVSTSIRRSATLIRSCSVSTVSSSSTGTARCVDDRAGVDAGVDHEQRAAGDLHAVRQRVGRPVHARERRRQRRMGVDIRPANSARNAGPTSFMKPAQHHQVRLVRRHGRRPAPRPSRARLGKSRDPVHERRRRRPARRARSPSMPCRSAPTATTRAPYAGSAAASSRAWRLVPEPETRTTRRAGTAGTARGESRSGASARSERVAARSGAATRSIASAAERAPPMPSARDGVQRDLGGERADVAASGRARPSRRPARRARRPQAGQDAAGAAAHRALLPAGGRVEPVRARRGERRDQRRRPAAAGVQPGAGPPSSGSAASSGNIGTRPEHHRGRAGDRGGADREARAEQVGCRRTAPRWGAATSVSAGVEAWPRRRRCAARTSR